MDLGRVESLLTATRSIVFLGNMRTRILAVTTVDGQFKLNSKFPPIRNPDGSVQEEDLTVIHIEHIEQVDPEGDIYGFYSVWAAAPDADEITKKGGAVIYKIGYDEVKRVVELVPHEDLKIRFESVQRTLTDEFKELSSDLPREALLVQKARIEKMLAAIDESDESADDPEPKNGEGTDVNQDQTSSGDSQP